MQSPANSILCDGCGRPASPDHIAGRVARLERATRFRPVHMNVLFLASAPLTRPEDDFYGSPQSRAFFESLMDALDIAPPAAEASRESDRTGDQAARLAEFQRKGYYLSYLAECPIPDETDSIAAAISALGPALIRRIRFNYKPKHIALLGSNMAPLIGILEKVRHGPAIAAAWRTAVDASGGRRPVRKGEVPYWLGYSVAHWRNIRKSLFGI